MSRADADRGRIPASSAADARGSVHRERPLLHAVVKLIRACDSALSVLGQRDGRGDAALLRVLSRCRTAAASGCDDLFRDETPAPDTLLELLAYAAAAKALLQSAGDPQLEHEASECEAALAAISAAAANLPAGPTACEECNRSRASGRDRAGESSDTGQGAADHGPPSAPATSP